MYQQLLKEGTSDHKYLRFPYLQDNNFEDLWSEIALNKVDLVCAETDKTEPTINDSGFITNYYTFFGCVVR